MDDRQPRQKKQALERSSFLGDVSPIAAVRKTAAAATATTVNDSIIGGVDPESFLSTRSFSGAAWSAGEAEEAERTRLRLAEAQARVRGLAGEAARARELEAELWRERQRSAHEQRARAAEQRRLEQLLREEKRTSPANTANVTTTTNTNTHAVVEEEENVTQALLLQQKECARLRQQLADANAQLAAARAKPAESSLAALSDVEAQLRDLRGDRALQLAEATLENERHAAEIAQLRARCRASDEQQAELVRLRARVSELELQSAKRGYLDEVERTAARLREENNVLKQKVTRMQTVSQKLAKTESEFERVNETLARWKVVVSDAFPSLEHVQDLVADLNGQISTLQFQNKALEQQASAARAAEKSVSLELKAVKEALRKEQENGKVREHAIGRLELELGLARDTIKSNQVLLESFNKEGSNFGNYDNAKATRITQLEQVNQKQGETIEKLQADLKAMEKAVSVANEELEKRTVQYYNMESRLVTGEFNPDTVQVVHMRMNPLSEKDEKTKEVARLVAENEVLRKRIATLKQQPPQQQQQQVQQQQFGVGSASSAQLESLKRDNVNLAKRLERLKQVAHTKITEFREVVMRLFGYRVDVDFDAHVYTLTLIGGHPDNQLKFKSDSATGVQLLETAFALALPDDITIYLQQYDSIPGFLSAIMVNHVKDE